VASVADNGMASKMDVPTPGADGLHVDHALSGAPVRWLPGTVSQQCA
jgi:hypothetical protein